MTEEERRTLRADLLLAFQDSEVIKVAEDGKPVRWDSATGEEAERMADLVFAVLDEHGLDVVEVPGASRGEREAAELATSYRVTDAGGQLIEEGSPVRYPNGVEGIFGRVITPGCVEVDGFAQLSSKFGLTVISVAPAELTMPDLPAEQ
jgi:hypothetical protein